MRDDQPFDQDKERRDPWHPDESYRLIPCEATGATVNSSFTASQPTAETHKQKGGLAAAL